MKGKGENFAHHSCSFQLTEWGISTRQNSNAFFGQNFLNGNRFELQGERENLNVSAPFHFSAHCQFKNKLFSLAKELLWGESYCSFHVSVLKVIKDVSLWQNVTLRHI